MNDLHLNRRGKPGNKQLRFLPAHESCFTNNEQTGVMFLETETNSEVFANQDVCYTQKRHETVVKVIACRLEINILTYQFLKLPFSNVIYSRNINNVVIY